VGHLFNRKEQHFFFFSQQPFKISHRTHRFPVDICLEARKAMDDRKRGYEVVAELNDQKRARPSGDSGMMNSTDVTSRIGVSRSDFGKVIGKGGQTIANIRAKCGAGIKGTEVSEEKRLVSDFFDFYV
jgi:predicted PilT family ATPase